MQNRILSWDGCSNVRDLGGFQMANGRQTRFHALIRSDTPARLTSAGWTSLYTYGVRTLITLRTVGMVEPELDVTPPYLDIAVVHAPIEDITDLEFRQKWASSDLWCTPLYFQDALDRWPARHAAVVSAIAQANPGGILFHCIRGNDRTGMISLLLLALVGARPADIVADYQLSPDSFRDELLARENTSVQEVIFSVLENLEIDDYLCGGGATLAELAVVRQRLLE